MTRKYKFSITSVLLAFAILCTLFMLPVSAEQEEKINVLSKIEPVLVEKLEKMNDNDLVSVSV